MPGTPRGFRHQEDDDDDDADRGQLATAWARACAFRFQSYSVFTRSIVKMPRVRNNNNTGGLRTRGIFTLLRVKTL